jgi:pyrimidine deaminase RibD-like protein
MSASERQFMELAIRLAGKSRPESSEAHPLVGAIIVSKTGEVLAESWRGMENLGEHAEFGALKRLGDRSAVGATVYTTLEPCTTRNHPKVPCAKRLVELRVARVVIGMLDPNQNICGRGIRLLRQAGIATDLFPSELMSEVESQNRDFIRDQESQEARLIPCAVGQTGSSYDFLIRGS